MAEDSARSPKDLVEASTILLENMEKRKIEADKSTRIQVCIAVCSVVVSAVLSIASFVQDKANNKSGEQWQQKVLDSLRQNNQVWARNQNEIQALKSNSAEQRAQLKAVQGSESRANQNDNQYSR